jgi:hypothetical protein
MPTSQPEVHALLADTSQTIKRRGLLAAGAAFVAGLIAKLSETPVSAGVDGDVVLGGYNTAASATIISNTTANDIALLTLGGGGVSGAGLVSLGSQYGVSAGVYESGSPGAGVLGEGRTNCPGVWGLNDTGLGVLGVSASSYGVFGQIPPTSNANTIAIYAQNYSTYAGSTPGAGGFAVYGLCAKGHGLVGATATAGGAAVVGATNGVPGAFAGAFYGPLVVSGNFTVVGGAKSAAVPHPDGSHRRLYCMESPESWFEDFGKTHLECGRADITIDPDFAAVADLSDYHVFLTAYDDFDLRVSGQTPTAFRVQSQNAMSSGRFSWRLVAKRKDITGARLEPVTVPSEPTLPRLPNLPPRMPPAETPRG